MKKTLLTKLWLLLAVMLAGAGTAWGEEVKYAISSKNTLTTTGTAPTGSSATIAETFSTSKQMTNENSQTLTLKGYDGYKITKLVLSMKSNGSTGAGSLAYSIDGGSQFSYIVGSSNSGVAFNNKDWNGSYTSSYTDITKEVSIECGTSEVVIKVAATTNSLYCQSYTIIYEENGSSAKTDPALAFSSNTAEATLGSSFTAPTLTNTYNVEVTWSSSDETVATVDNGTVTLKAEGTTVIKAAFDGDETYKASDASYTLTVTDPSKVTIWSEDFSNFDSNKTTYSYQTPDSGTKTYNETSAGGTSPELLIKANSTFTATIPLDNISGDLTLSYKTNANSLSVSTTTDGISGSGTSSTKDTHTVTFTGVKSSMKSIVIVFTAGNKNVRIDDIVLTGAKDTRKETAIVLSKNALSLDLEGNTSVVGDLTATLVDGDLETINQAITFTIAPEAGLTYDSANGKVTATAVGTYTITASYAGDETYKPAEDETCTVTVENSAVVEAPVFSVATGAAVSYGTVVTITNKSGNFEYFYTIDGTEPTYNEDLEATGTTKVYGEGITITEGVTIKAVAVNLSNNASEVTTVSYTIAAPAAPTFSPVAGAVDEGTTVTLSADVDVILYTTDGTTPSYEKNVGEIYSDPIEITEAMTIKAIAVDNGGNESEVVSAEYTIKEVASIDLRGKTDAITFNTNGFTLASGYDSNDKSDQTVKDVNNTEFGGWSFAKIQKGNGGVQLKASTGKITLPLVKSDNGFSVSVKATTNSVTISDGTNNATATAGTNDGVGTLDVSAQTGNITISAGSSYAVITEIVITPAVTYNVETPVFTPAGGTYTEVQNVTITTETTGAEIYYTTNGDVPTAESSKYTTPIEVAENMTIKAIAIKDGENSAVATATYVIDLPLTSIAEVKALDSGDEFKLNLTGAQVVYVDGDHMYVRDNSSAIEFYQSGLSLTTGDIFNATIAGTYTLYNGLPEITTFTQKDVTKTGNSVVVAKEITTLEDAKANVCNLVKFAGVQLTGSGNTYYIGETGVQLYDKFKVNYEEKTDADVDVTGVVILYQRNNTGTITTEVCPRFATDVVYLDNAVAVEIGAAGMATFSSDKALDFTGVDAILVYKATVTDDVVNFTRIRKVPARTGVLLRNPLGESAVAAIQIPILSDNADDVSDNELIAVTETIDNLATDAGNGKTNYILNKVNNVVGFYWANNKRVAAGKAYLQVGNGVRGFIGFNEDDVTAINDESMVNNGALAPAIYNLNGQRVKNPKSGLYIINGKKTIIK